MTKNPRKSAYSRVNISHHETVPAGQTSAPVLAHSPGSFAPITVAVAPAVGATALIEFTLAPRADVEADPGAVTWHAWPQGAVTAAATDVLVAPVTALRCTATGGAVEWSVLA